MIAVDGEFFRATVDGRVHPVEPSRTTPFAVVTFFDVSRRGGRLSDPSHDVERMDDRVGRLRLPAHVAALVYRRRYTAV
jgi:alpha-acetolactate decarboxylase